VVVWAGDGSPGKHDRQPFFFADALLAVREAAATPLKEVTKKAQRHPHGHEHGPTAPAIVRSVDNIVRVTVTSTTIVSTGL
jgi:hypothetical protein